MFFGVCLFVCVCGVWRCGGVVVCVVWWCVWCGGVVYGVWCLVCGCGVCCWHSLEVIQLLSNVDASFMAGRDCCLNECF